MAGAPNWFVALPVVAGDWFAPLVADAPTSLRLFHPDDLHLTVAFLGSCGEERARGAFSLADDVHASPFEVRLETLKPMGNPRRPSALSLTVSRGHAEAVAIMRALRDDMLTLCDAPPETRAPVPHITVARPRRNARGDERRAALDWAAGKAAVGATLTIDAIALYTRSEEPGDRQYRTVVHCPLS